MSKTEYPGITWHLDCEPRVVQLEALARSYTGKAWRDNKDDPMPSKPLFNLKPHAPGFGFFMMMRLGKSYTTLNEFLMYHYQWDIDRMLILSPNRYKWAWAGDIEAMGMPELGFSPFVFESGTKGRKAFAEYSKHRRGVVIINYEALRSDTTFKLVSEWAAGAYIAGDESIIIKNPQSVITKAALNLSKKAPVVRALTGKPVVQSPADLWAQLRFAKQLNGKNFFAFRAKYVVMGGFKMKVPLGAKNEDQLNAALQKVSFVAHRREWGTWHEPDFMSVSVEMTGEQAKHYASMNSEFVMWLNDSGDSVTAEQVATKSLKLRQISSGFVYDEFGSPHALVKPSKNPKLKLLREMMTTEIEGKLVVLGVHKPVIKMLIDELREFNPAVIGGPDKTDVEAEKHRFNNDPECRIIVCQSQVTKYGHSLHANGECNTIAVFESDYNYDTRAQVLERTYHPDNTSGVTVIDFFASPVEKAVIQALQRKESISDAVLKHRASTNATEAA